MTQRSSGTSAAIPLIAASTCSQAPAPAVTAAMSATGSKAPDEVVPRVAHTKNGTRPASRSAAIAAARASGRMANALSWATTRIASVPMPAIRSPFSTLEWAWAVA